jgi:hypothetical protein
MEGISRLEARMALQPVFALTVGTSRRAIRIPGLSGLTLMYPESQIPMAPPGYR